MIEGGSRPTVALVGTLDTKGAEYEWVAGQLAGHGVGVLVVDAGIRAPVGFPGPLDPAAPSGVVRQDDVAAAAGTSIAALRDGNDRGVAVTAMGEGAAAVLGPLVARGDVHGVLALGGSGGSSI